MIMLEPELEAQQETLEILSDPDALTGVSSLVRSELQ